MFLEAYVIRGRHNTATLVEIRVRGNLIDLGPRLVYDIHTARPELSVMSSGS